MAGRKRKSKSQGERPGDAAMWGVSSNGGSSSSRRKTSSRGGAASGGGSGGGSSRGLSSSHMEAAATKMFNSYKDDDDPMVATMEGISKLCDDIEIDPLEDVRILVLMWKLGAKEKPAQITKEEWIKGCSTLRLDSVEKIKDMLPALDTGFLDRDDFKDFYKFTFQFNREGTHRTLEKSLVTALLSLVLKDRIEKNRLDTFVEFLEALQGEANARITLDQWTSFLEFCYEVEDLSEYDEESSAWPVLIDEYVEYMKEKKK